MKNTYQTPELYIYNVATENGFASTTPSGSLGDIFGGGIYDQDLD